MAQMGVYSSGVDIIPGVDSPFFSTIVLFKNRIAVSPGVLMVSWKEIRIPGFRMDMAPLEKRVLRWPWVRTYAGPITWKWTCPLETSDRTSNAPFRRALVWPALQRDGILMHRMPFLKARAEEHKVAVVVRTVYFGVGEFTTHFSVVGLGCSLGVQDFDPWPCQ